MFYKEISLILLLVFCFNSCASSSQNINSNKSTISNNIDSDDDFMDEFDDESSNNEDGSDPLSGYNELMTSFNDTAYQYVLKPIANGYRFIVPHFIRQGVGNFFTNLFYPIRFINNLLQGKIKNASEESARFIINTTLGLFGFFDPATSLYDLKPHNEDFGQTLGYWGVGSGYHIVLPFFGPSNMRDLFGSFSDTAMDPVSYNKYALELHTYKRLNKLSLNINEYDMITKDAIQLYPFLKNLYEQRRKKLIEE